MHSKQYFSITLEIEIVGQILKGGNWCTRYLFPLNNHLWFYLKLGQHGSCLNFWFDTSNLQALGTYTLIDGNTGQKLVDEKDIGNDESIRTEYEIEEVNIEADE